MTKFLNIIEKLLTMILALTYFLGLTRTDSIFLVIIILFLSISIFFTSLTDMAKNKKVDVKYSILNIVLILVLLLNIYRPFIDVILIKDFNLESFMLFNYSADLIKQNILLITIFMAILFILNFKMKKD